MKKLNLILIMMVNLSSHINTHHLLHTCQHRCKALLRYASFQHWETSYLFGEWEKCVEGVIKNRGPHPSNQIVMLYHQFMSYSHTTNHHVLGKIYMCLQFLYSCGPHSLSIIYIYTNLSQSEQFISLCIRYKNPFVYHFIQQSYEF